MFHHDVQLVIARQIVRERVADAERRRLVNEARPARPEQSDRPARSRWWRSPTRRLRPRQLAPC